MLCNSDNPVISIVGVEHMKWGSTSYKVEPRAYSALSFRVNGSADIQAAGKNHHITSGDILYLPQNTEYTANYTDTEIICIHFTTLQNDTEIEVYPFESGEQIYKKFLRLKFLWNNKEPGYITYCMAQLYSIFGDLAEKSTNVVPEYFLKAVSFINQSYTDCDLSIDKICAESGVSATILRRLFKKYYGKTPTEYITSFRLEYARNLISSGVSVESAAFESGFNDSKYFARVVKKQFGCSPREFKAYGK